MRKLFILVSLVGIGSLFGCSNDAPQMGQIATGQKAGGSKIQQPQNPGGKPTQAPDVNTPQAQTK